MTTQTRLAGPLPSVGNTEQLKAVNFSAETDAAGKEMPPELCNKRVNLSPFLVAHEVEAVSGA